MSRILIVLVAIAGASLFQGCGGRYNASAARGFNAAVYDAADQVIEANRPSTPQSYTVTGVGNEYWVTPN